ncbi:MAG: SprT-like domain-containing protein [Nitrospira sp.]|nr:SprT-like domain-containing protein [Nitrospira sp.]MDE0486556.1 SprT-like domain-containing protein [Nitrospira sp.]
MRTRVENMALRTPGNVPLSVEHLQAIWRELNGSYFQNRLPAIEIQWSNRLTASAGLFRSRTGPRTSWVALEERHGKGRVIRLSVPLLSRQPFEEIRGTLAHEMIHQWQFDVKKWCPSHGREFRRIMALMNNDGLGITIYHTLGEDARVSVRFTWRCVWCGHAYHRHRNTLSTKRHRCGLCRGPLQEIVDRTTGGESSSRPSPQPAPRGSNKQGGLIQLAFQF